MKREQYYFQVGLVVHHYDIAIYALLKKELVPPYICSDNLRCFFEDYRRVVCLDDFGCWVKSEWSDVLFLYD